MGSLVYKGSFKNGLKQGKGTGYHHTGTVNYEGDWEDDMMHGKGRLFSILGDLLYDGVFLNGQPQVPIKKGKAVMSPAKRRNDTSELNTNDHEQLLKEV